MKIQRRSHLNNTAITPITQTNTDTMDMGTITGKRIIFQKIRTNRLVLNDIIPLGTIDVITGFWDVIDRVRQVARKG